MPYFKRQAVQILKASYASNAEASAKIPAALTAYYRQAIPRYLTSGVARLRVQVLCSLPFTTATFSRI